MKYKYDLTLRFFKLINCSTKFNYEIIFNLKY